MKKIVDSDYVSLKLSFDDVNIPLSSLLIIKKYLFALKNLDCKIQKLKDDSMVNANIDANINYFIGFKLFSDIYRAVSDKDKKLLNQTLKLIKKETKRITEFKHNIHTDCIYNCSLNKEQARAIMLEYMNHEDLCKTALRVYPDDVKSLVKTSN